eukprot:632215-Pyramimonas_sp.AAC.1
MADLGGAGITCPPPPCPSPPRLAGAGSGRPAAPPLGPVPRFGPGRSRLGEYSDCSLCLRPPSWGSLQPVSRVAVETAGLGVVSVWCRSCVVGREWSVAVGA